MAPKWSTPVTRSLLIDDDSVHVAVEHGLMRDTDTSDAANDGKGMLRLTIPSGHKITIPLEQLWELIGGFNDWRIRGAPEATKPEKGDK